jgi:hypothetical protein
MTIESDPSSANGSRHLITQGDCVSSIAYENGFFWKTLWGHPGNAELKRLRKDPNVLLPGDTLFVPNKQARTEARNTEARHTFVRIGVPEYLRIALADAEGKPRAGLKFALEVEGQTTTGATDGEGVVESRIQPNARSGTLTLNPGAEGEEVYELMLGHIDPVTEITGAQARLNNLGFDCPIDGELGPDTQAAIEAFQEKKRLPVTGNLDDKTRSALADEHAF